MQYDVNKSKVENIVALINSANPNLNLQAFDVSIISILNADDSGDGYNANVAITVSNSRATYLAGNTTVQIQRQMLYALNGDTSMGQEAALNAPVTDRAALEAAVADQFNLLPSEYVLSDGFPYDNGVEGNMRAVVTANDDSLLYSGNFGFNFTVSTPQPVAIDAAIAVKKIGKFEK